MNAPHSLPPDLEAWLAEHPEVDAADLAPTWRLAEGGDPTDAAPPPDPARIRAIEAALAHEAAGTERPALRLVVGARSRWPWVAAAAVVVLLMAAGLGWWLRPASLTAPAGQTLSATLPDGSQVQLNSGATLTYPRSFGDDIRRVRLEGEGFFEVAQAGTPFIIETFNADVTVLGTQFNVRAWPDEQGAQTVVSVVSGTVQVAARQAQEDAAIVLQAGQHSRVAADAPAPTPPAPARLDEATAWRDGSFVFYNQPLAVLFDEIHRRFGIDVEASETIRARPFTFSRRRARSAEALVKDLCQAARLRYRLTANGFLIFDANNDPAYDG